MKNKTIKNLIKNRFPWTKGHGFLIFTQNPFHPRDSSRGFLVQNKAKFNLLFVLVFLNIWDFAVNRDFFNGMVMGILMFGPSAFFWFIGTVRAAAVVALISLFEFTVLSVFIIDGLSAGLKSVFWVPYLAMAGLNLSWGLTIYTNYRKKKEKGRPK